MKKITLPLEEWEATQRKIERLTGVNKELIKGKKVIILENIEATFGVEVLPRYDYNELNSRYDLISNSGLIFPKDLKQYEDACISLESHNEAVRKLLEVINDKSLDVKKEFEAMHEPFRSDYRSAKVERDKLKRQLDQLKTQLDQLKTQLENQSNIGLVVPAFLIALSIGCGLGALIF